MTSRSLSSNVLAALQGVRFIAQHIRDADKDNEVIYSSITSGLIDNYHASLKLFILTRKDKEIQQKSGLYD